MKFIDRFLRNWRIKMVKPYIRANDSVLDIGCFDETLFEKLKTKPILSSIGIDPLLPQPIEGENYTLLPGKFPDDLKKKQTFDSITMLAVLEHIPTDEQVQLRDNCCQYLNTKGRIIITVPSPFVDHILWILTKLKLIDGMSLEEHYGFKVKDVPVIFNSEQLRLIKHKRFQLGLNNLFVFEKIR
ncbi:methyltransferase domain-containing protein [Winogradskyella sp. Asnod2-B02-A]|uniref:methyltransferase domain-containing protein n=1 Tax=Winogradskyella sp. Asnod2-B02-A TaxID=3160583 RepID=UPI00386BC40C